MDKHTQSHESGDTKKDATSQASTTEKSDQPTNEPVVGGPSTVSVSE
jgi:hypothetical protein